MNGPPEPGQVPSVEVSAGATPMVVGSGPVFGVGVDGVALAGLVGELARVGVGEFTSAGYRRGVVEHVVLFRYKEGTSVGVREEVAGRFRGLVSECVRGGVPYVLSIVGGVQSSGEGAGKGLEHGFVVRFASEGDRNFYVGEPVVSDPGFFDGAHAAFKEFVGPYVEDVLVFDFTAS